MNELFGEGLRDVYAANQRGAEAAEATAAAASNPELKQMLQSGTEMAKGQVKRLEQVFGAIGAQPSGRQNAVIDGIITARTFCDPRASHARAATTAESMPPDKPMTAEVKRFLRA